jgi:predicted aspartyl protease
VFWPGRAFKRFERVPFAWADDKVMEFEVGEARLRLDKRVRTVLVVFGPDGSSPLPGATALELFNRAIDSVHHVLVPVTAILKSYVSR